jgi:hypothetical protein
VILIRGPFSDNPLTRLRQYKIPCRDRLLAALTGDRERLERVLSRDELALSLPVGYLEWRLRAG